MWQTKIQIPILYWDKNKHIYRQMIYIYIYQHDYIYIYAHDYMYMYIHIIMCI